MNIIIVGAGEIGRHLAISLSQLSHNIAVVEKDERIARELEAAIDGRVIWGDGATVNTLLEARVERCHLLLAVTSDDKINLVSGSLAKPLGAGMAVCRVHPKVQREEWMFDYKTHFGIDHLFSSERLASVELAKFIRNPESMVVEEIARGLIELQQMVIEEDSPAVGKQILELGFPSRVRIGAITRGDKTFVPKASDEIRAGDCVTLFGEPRKLQEESNRLRQARITEETDGTRVVIFGGGEYGFALAQMLSGLNCRVRVFESDAARCEELSHQLSNTTIINADATSPQELREEQLDHADFFVATSESDEDNVMACIQAKNLGTKQCLTLVHRADYADAITTMGSAFGIKAAVSPREATRRELMRFITSDRYHVVCSFGEVDLIEIRVAEGAALAGKVVREVSWPGGSGLVALLRGVQATVPAADDVIEAGNHLFALVSRPSLKAYLKLF